MKPMAARLRHDLNYLRTIITEAGALNPPRSSRDQALRSVLHDYLTWLAVDALDDETLARELVPILTKLQNEMDDVARDLRKKRRLTDIPAFYKTLLSAMVEILSFRYGEDLLHGAPISRDEFGECWLLTRKALDL